jgi:hypothetical protein
MELRTDKQIWQEDYMQPMFKKYESVPTKLKYIFIKKDFVKMFGKELATYHLNMMSPKCDDFIFGFENALYEFSKTIKKNLLKKYFEELALDEWYKLQELGVFYEYFPNLSGKWLQDKEFFINFVTERENKKEYIDLIFNTKPE